jgi:hypothetical protein
MRALIAILAALHLAAAPTLAGCQNAIRLLPNAQNDSCERIGLEVNFEKSIREDLVRGDYNARIVKEQEKQLQIKDLTLTAYEKKDGLQTAEIERVRKRADEIEGRQKTDFWLGLGIGIGLAVVSAWIVKQVAR